MCEHNSVYLDVLFFIDSGLETNGSQLVTD